MDNVKFSVEKMRSVYNRLSEIDKKIADISSSTSQSYSVISDNMQSEGIKITIKQYTYKAEQDVEEFRQSLKVAMDYLDEKIRTYTSTDVAGEQSMSAVKNLLDQMV